MGGPIASVRQVARAMGLTRARVYQLLNEINDIMNVRPWPAGRHHVYELNEKFQAESARMVRPPDLSQFGAAVELFYPGARRRGPPGLSNKHSRWNRPPSRPTRPSPPGGNAPWPRKHRPPLETARTYLG